VKVRDDQTKRRRGRLQKRSEARRDVLFGPKYQPVIQTERQDARNQQQEPVTTILRQRNAASANDQKNNQTRDHKPDARKRQWWEIGEAELDE
jgi:hypothetical protein